MLRLQCLDPINSSIVCWVNFTFLPEICVLLGCDSVIVCSAGILSSFFVARSFWKVALGRTRFFVSFTIWTFFFFFFCNWVWKFYLFIFSSVLVVVQVGWLLFLIFWISWRFLAISLPGGLLSHKGYQQSRISAWDNYLHFIDFVYVALTSQGKFNWPFRSLTFEHFKNGFQTWLIESITFWGFVNAG